jgi:hypothetical protein
MSEFLSVLVAVDITDAMFISSTAPETDHAAWSSGTTYTVGQRCISTTTHRIYESLANANVGKDPTDIANRTGSTVWWQDVDPTNKWAMLDGEVSTQTVLASPLTIVIRPGFFNALYLGGVDAENLSVEVRDAPAGNIIYSFSGALEASMPPDYYEHFFDRFKPQTDFLASGIDQYNDAEVSLTLTSATGTVKLGVIALGDLRPLGKTQYGAKAKPKTYSYIKVDEFGKNKIKRRKAAKDMSLSAWLKLEEANSVLETITSLLDVPCVWIGTGLPEYTGLRVFGLGSGEISYDKPKDCLLTIDVQGLI